MLCLFFLYFIFSFVCTTLWWIKLIKSNRRSLGYHTGNFICSLTNAKRSFYRSANAIFGKVGRIAPEEATLQLISSKCVPVLIYGLEACPLLKSDLSSLDFIINRFFMKLFRTSSIEVVEQCQYYFNFPLPGVLLDKRVNKFEDKINACNNLLCKINIR